MHVVYSLQIVNSLRALFLLLGCPRGNLRPPNGVFQTVFFRFLTSACNRGKPHQRDEECLKTPVFSSILVPSAVTDPDRPPNAPLRKTPSRKHRLLLLGARPVITKLVGRVFETGDSNPIRRKHGKCGRPLSPQKHGLRRCHRASPKNLSRRFF